MLATSANVKVAQRITEVYRPGSDDTVFHFDLVPVETCKTLAKEQLGAWNEQER
jgi:hypothetical protein